MPGSQGTQRAGTPHSRWEEQGQQAGTPIAGGKRRDKGLGHLTVDRKSRDSVTGNWRTGASKVKGAGFGAEGQPRTPFRLVVGGGWEGTLRDKVEGEAGRKQEGGGLGHSRLQAALGEGPEQQGEGLGPGGGRWFPSICKCKDHHPTASSLLGAQMQRRLSKMSPWGGPATSVCRRVCFLTRRCWGPLLLGRHGMEFDFKVIRQHACLETLQPALKSKSRFQWLNSFRCDNVVLWA